MLTDDRRTLGSEAHARIESEQVRLLHKGLPAAIVSQLLIAAITLWTLRNVVPQPAIVLWLALFVALQSARAGFFWTHRDPPVTPAQQRTRLAWLRVGIAFTGLTWGLLPVALFPVDQPIYQLLLPFVAGGITATALVTLSVDRVSAWLFILPVLVPLILRLIVQGGEISTAMAALITLYLIFVADWARRNHRAFIDNLQLRGEVDKRHAALQVSDARLREAQRLAHLGYWTLDIESGVLEWTDELYSIYRRDPAHFRPNLDVYYRELVHPDDLATVRAVEQAALRNPGQAQSVDHRFVLPGGEVRWIHLEGVASSRIDGRPTQLQGTAQDITERMRDSERLHESNLRIRVILDTVVDGVITINEQGIVESFNPAAERIFGYPAHEAIGRNVSMLMPEPDRSAHDGYLQNYLRTGQRRTIGQGREVRGQRRDGSGFPLDLAVSETWLNGRRIFIGLVRDITDRKTEQEALNRFKSTLDQIHDCVFMFEPDSLRFFYANQGAIDQIGYSVDELMGMHPYDIKPEFPERAFREQIAPLLTGETASLTFETLHRHKDGHTIPVEIFLQLVSPRGEMARFVALVHDISERRRAESELRETRNFLSTVIDSLPVMLFVKDARELRFVTFNRAGEDLLGITRDRLIGKSDHDLFPREQADFFTTRDRQVLESGRPLEIGEEPIATANRGQRWLRTIKVPIVGSDGQPAYLLGISTDITEAREAAERLRHAHAKNQSILDAVPDLMLQIDDDGRFVDYHAFNAQDLTFPAETFMGKTVAEVIPQPLGRQLGAAMKRLSQDDTVQVLEYSFPDSRGIAQDWEARVARVATGGYLIIIRNITERKRVDRMKNEFVSTVSHELRTPLTSIRGSLGLIMGGVAGALPNQAHELIDIAYKNSERLSRLINDILDIEKIESGRMQFALQPLEIMPLIDHAIAANRGFGEQYRVHFLVTAVAPGVRVQVDAERFMQVMANLLSNAAKFSPSGGEVEIAVSAQLDRVRVAVTDHGPGIPEEFRDRIFDKFSQADGSDTRSKGGSGLGLSIAKSIIERMDGKIAYQSVAGRGTTFHFELPMLPPPAVDAPVYTSDARRDNAPRILVCEDDADIARVMSGVLAVAGFHADVVGSAAEARARLGLRHYDAMTLDLMLPDGDGISLIRAVRADPATRNLPIVVVSARAEEGRAQINGGFGVVDWLTKPINERLLGQSVERAIHAYAGYRVRILHVEDDPDVRRVVATLAGNVGDFDYAETLAEARAKLKLEQYGLVILDISLPDGSGWDLLAYIEKLDCPPPVMVFSGTELPAEQAKQVASALLKSDASNDDIVKTLRASLRRPGD